MTVSETVSAGQLRAFIERIERLEEEKKTISNDIKDVKAEAKGSGFSVAIINEIIKLRKKDPAERAEQESLLDIYKAALGMLPLEEYADRDEASQSYAGAKGRGVVAKIATTETGEITDTQEQPETATQSQSVHEARSMPAESVGDEISERVGLAGPACAHDDETANTKPAPNSLSAEVPTAADKPETAARPFPAVSGAIPEGIPAFLLKERKPLRPNCLHPENCGGYGSHTCYSCARAAADEVAA